MPKPASDLESELRRIESERKGPTIESEKKGPTTEPENEEPTIETERKGPTTVSENEEPTIESETKGPKVESENKEPNIKDASKTGSTRKAPSSLDFDLLVDQDEDGILELFNTGGDRFWAPDRRSPRVHKRVRYCLDPPSPAVAKEPARKPSETELEEMID